MNWAPQSLPPCAALLLHSLSPQPFLSGCLALSPFMSAPRGTALGELIAQLSALAAQEDTVQRAIRIALGCAASSGELSAVASSPPPLSRATSVAARSRSRSRAPLPKRPPRRVDQPRGSVVMDGGLGAVCGCQKQPPRPRRRRYPLSWQAVVAALPAAAYLPDPSFPAFLLVLACSQRLLRVAFWCRPSRSVSSTLRLQPTSLLAVSRAGSLPLSSVCRQARGPGLRGCAPAAGYLPDPSFPPRSSSPSPALCCVSSCRCAARPAPRPAQPAAGGPRRRLGVRAPSARAPAASSSDALSAATATAQSSVVPAVNPRLTRERARRKPSMPRCVTNVLAAQAQVCKLLPFRGPSPSHCRAGPCAGVH